MMRLPTISETGSRRALMFQLAIAILSQTCSRYSTGFLCSSCQVPTHDLFQILERPDLPSHRVGIDVDFPLYLHSYFLVTMYPIVRSILVPSFGRIHSRRLAQTKMHDDEALGNSLMGVVESRVEPGEE